MLDFDPEECTERRLFVSREAFMLMSSTWSAAFLYDVIEPHVVVTQKTLILDFNASWGDKV